MSVELLREKFPFLEPELVNEIETSGSIKHIPSGTTILTEGGYVPATPIVLKGLIKVFSRSEERDLLLYYIRPGESCIMSFASCMKSEPSKIEAVTEEDTELLLLSQDQMKQWQHQFYSLHSFFHELYHLRFLELLTTVDQLIFGNLEERLIYYIQEQVRNTGSKELQLTHQQIANDLGTAREVISRALKKLAVTGRIQLARNTIKLLSDK